MTRVCGFSHAVAQPQRHSASPCSRRTEQFIPYLCVRLCSHLDLDVWGICLPHTIYAPCCALLYVLHTANINIHPRSLASTPVTPYSPSSLHLCAPLGRGRGAGASTSPPPTTYSRLGPWASAPCSGCGRRRIITSARFFSSRLAVDKLRACSPEPEHSPALPSLKYISLTVYRYRQQLGCGKACTGVSLFAI